jgi:hypothetical protein
MQNRETGGRSTAFALAAGGENGARHDPGELIALVG